MEHNKIIFEMAYKKKWVELQRYIVKHIEDGIDFNIRDKFGNFLINYFILSDQKDLMRLALDNNAQIDFLDNDGRTILFNPIRYNFIDQIQMLLQHDNNNIGLSIVEIKDKYSKIPLHYAIISQNIEAIEILLKNNSDPKTTDKDGNNSLHLAVYSKNLEICKMILATNINIDSQTNAGETPLHIAVNHQMRDIVELLINSHANLNKQDYDHDLTPLMYAINLNDTYLSKQLIDNGANINSQDFMGNTPLHHAIAEENNIIIKNIIDKQNVNLYLYNVLGKLPIHFVLDKENIFDDNSIRYIIVNSDLNFPDNGGDTALHLIFKNGYTQKYEDQLAIKKLNIFIPNKKGKRPIDYVKDEDHSYIIDLVAKSYLYVLRNYQSLWIEDWEMICSKKDIEKSDDECIQIIKDKITKAIKNKNYTCDSTSFPRKRNKTCVKLSKESNLEFCSFTGITLDILFGLIYLLKKFPTACSTIPTNFVKNENLCEYYKIIGVNTNTRCDFYNFEIVWIERRLFLSDKFAEHFNICIKKTSTRFIIIPLGIEMREGNHANYLIFDKKTYEMERFEPYGYDSPYGFNYNPGLLDNMLKTNFLRINENIKFISPANYLPKIGFQYLDVIEQKTKKIGDPGGFCAIWSLWYTEMRLTYPDIQRKSLVGKLMKEIKTNSSSYRDLMRNYSGNIIKMRDTVLRKVNITINDLLNDKFTNDQMNMIIDEIKIMMTDS